jgi:hypothetical protein
MDATTLNTIVGIVGIIVGIIGAVVGIVGWNSLSTAMEMKNRAKADNGASVQQAQTIHNGIDSYAVIRLSRDTTQQELARLVKEIQLATKSDIRETISSEVEPAIKRLTSMEQKMEALPRVHIGTVEPEDMQDGDIWFVPVDE